MADTNPPAKAATAGQQPITKYTKDSWQTITKKRKIADSPPGLEKTPSVASTKVRHTVIPTYNKFSLLDADTNAVSDSPQTNGNDTDATPLSPLPTTKKAAPPPIIIQGVSDCQAMIKRVTLCIPNDHFQIKALANKAVKVNVTEVDSYRKLVRELKERKIQFFTYQIKAERAFKVVIRNLHPTMDPEEISKAIQEEGYSVRSVSNIRHPRTKDPLPLFFVNLEPTGEFKKIYELKSLLHHRVTIESPRPRKEIPQCMRCQQYGHTRTYCSLQPICVRCGQEHDSRACTKAPDAPPTCALCEGPHTANYRGCPEFLKLKTSVSRPPTTHKQDNSKVKNNASSLPLRPTEPKSQTTGSTYAKAAKQDPPESSSTTSMSRIEQIFEKMCSQIELMMNQNTQLLALLTQILTKLVK